VTASRGDCPLCRELGGALVWRGGGHRVILVDEPDHPGFCRVVWDAHVAEMTDLATVDAQRLMATVFSVERVLRDQLRPDKIDLRQPWQRGAAPALARHPALDRRQSFPRPGVGAVEARASATPHRRRGARRRARVRPWTEPARAVAAPLEAGRDGTHLHAGRRVRLPRSRFRPGPDI
jgi:hypothetical protein